tara:strand:- start:2459 stop:4303 length:1845 start_codon:yes stop_codon:yes gene_type:complete
MSTGNDAYEFIAARAQNDGWQIKSQDDGEIIIKTCPFCQNKNDHFYINASKDGSPYHCQRCKASGNLTTLKRHLNIDVDPSLPSFTRLGNVKEFSHLRIEEPKKTLPIEWIDSYHDALMQDEHNALTALKERGISETTAKEFKIGVKNEPKAKRPMWVFPYFSNSTQGPHISLVKYRNVPPDQPKKMMSREAGMASPLFNADKLDYDKNSIVLCEGEIDAMSIRQCGHCNVVSGAVGAGGKGMKSEWFDLLSQFNRVILVYDPDEAGQITARDFQRKLGEEVVINVELPNGMDANDVLKAHGDAFLFEIIDKATDKPIEGVESLAQALEGLQEELMLEGTLDTGLPWHWPLFNESLAKVNFGEFWIVTGQEGRGKTTLMKQQLLEWAKLDVPCLLWCAEMPIRQIARQYVQSITSTRKQDLTQETLAVAYEQIADVPLYVAYPSLDPTIESLISIMNQAYREYDIRIFAVDNLMMLTMNARSNEVNHEQGRVAKALKAFAVYNECSVFLVAHPKKPERDDDDRIETANLISGSKMVAQLADNAFTVYRKNLQAKHSSELDGNPLQLLDSVTTIIPLKARDSAGKGWPQLIFEDDYSRFREATAADYDGVINLRP